jgi:hypothetical protein
MDGQTDWLPHRHRRRPVLLELRVLVVCGLYGHARPAAPALEEVRVGHEDAVAGADVDKVPKAFAATEVAPGGGDVLAARALPHPEECGLRAAGRENSRVFASPGAMHNLKSNTNPCLGTEPEHVPFRVFIACGSCNNSSLLPGA